MSNPTTPAVPANKPQSTDTGMKTEHDTKNAGRPDQDNNKTGRPQDDRDPNSPARGTQRPGEPMNIEKGDNKHSNEGSSPKKN